MSGLSLLTDAIHQLVRTVTDHTSALSAQSQRIRVLDRRICDLEAQLDALRDRVLPPLESKGPASDLESRIRALEDRLAVGRCPNCSPPRAADQPVKTAGMGERYRDQIIEGS